MDDVADYIFASAKKNQLLPCWSFTWKLQQNGWSYYTGMWKH
jgi:hypothetical protein